MAHWDQRDPRWLVSELGSTGSNVNGWHWEEKNKLEWCRSRLHEMTNGMEVELDPAVGFAKLTGLDELTGEAYVTRRKGNKTLAVYDLCVTLTWLGRLASEENEVAGAAKISEFALGNDSDDYILVVTTDNQDQKYTRLVEAVKGTWPKLLQVLTQFDTEIRKLEQ